MGSTNALDDVDDAELVRRHVAGEDGCFSELVRRHRDRAWAVALRTTGDREDAADAVQDAFVSALRNVASFRGDSQFSTWLHRIVVNACLDRMRRRKLRPTTPLDDDLPIADPHDAIGARDLSMDITTALTAISDEQRLAILLVDVEGRSVEEAASILGVAEGTVKSRCSRGRARLAVLLGHLREGNRALPQDVVATTPADAGSPRHRDEPPTALAPGGGEPV